MRSVAILHFSPIEFYPPVQNIIRQLGVEHETSYFVYTTKNTRPELSTFGVRNRNIEIKRFGKSGNGLAFHTRLWSYAYFQVGTLLHLVITRPGKILYYETLSFFPVYIYKKLFNRKVNVWAHYHEYASPQEYEQGMKLVRWFHKLEREMYNDMFGVSHTNDYRLQLFLSDIAPARPRQQLAIPNYPPRLWGSVSSDLKSDITRIVYIGALSLDTMFAREFAGWVIAQQGRVTWDIYTFNMSLPAKSYFDLLNSPFITVRPGVDYDKLPEVLSRYDIGVILYTGHIVNYMHNAPNKLFEYLRMGLQVWLPDSLLGARPYLESNKHPRVLSLNFKELTLSLDKIVTEKKTTQHQFIAEDANVPLLHFLSQKDEG